MSESERIINELKLKFPGTSIVPKKGSKLMKLIDICLKIITFGQMKTFMTRFYTTIGRTIYVPNSWKTAPDKSKAVVLRHEGTHIAQEARVGKWKFRLMYLLLPFPVLFARCRRDFEQEAYAETMRAKVEYFGPDSIKSQYHKDFIINQFTSASYFWTWPWKKQLNEWYDSTVAMLVDGND